MKNGTALKIPNVSAYEYIEVPRLTCIFCGWKNGHAEPWARLSEVIPLKELMDHFAREHGRVV